MTTDFEPGRATRFLTKPGIGKVPWSPSRVVRKFQLMVEDVARESGNDPEKATPAMMWFAGPDQLVTMRMILSSEPVDQLSVIAYGVTQGELPPPEWVIYAAEGWSTEPSPDKPGEDFSLEPNELHDRHAIGMTGVGEGIVINMAARDGSGWMYLQTYTRVGSEHLEWGEPHTTSYEDMRRIRPDIETYGRVDRLLRIMVGQRDWDGF